MRRREVVGCFGMQEVAAGGGNTEARGREVNTLQTKGKGHSVGAGTGVDGIPRCFPCLAPDVQEMQYWSTSIHLPPAHYIEGLDTMITEAHLHR